MAIEIKLPNGTRDAWLLWDGDCDLDECNKPSEFDFDISRVALWASADRAHAQSDLLLSMSSKSGMLPGPPADPPFWPIRAWTGWFEVLPFLIWCIFEGCFGTIEPGYEEGYP